ncbi:hypothetical protein [Thalassotalea euphylliae]|uniref:SPOR domain-containing protein n=1 Tax=Thalassotalea euphylliae TaxID=1655234 RepID=A0A3E0UJB4_9GAMM|nr:hypothetical protein [Thalassotalea euphylliae]REL36999.1 hypothetical protein DXX92_17700 [Thalassotalea euphylliae]
MMALATSENQTTDKNVMSISTNARIDYILKFSRHMVVVLDDQQSGFGSISGTYLESLSEQTNAALVPVSSKLNDVQVRARINEQLFPGEAFDPEISLTQSVVEHYINQQLPIAIVIEHAHHLSLQIVHELTLLSELAKKSGRDIAVVLLGQTALGKLVVTNYSLFNKKLSMISAANGQLISVNAELFKSKVSFLTLTPFNKLVIGLVVLLALTFVTLYVLYQRDAMTFSQLPEQNDLSEGTATVVKASELIVSSEASKEQSAEAATAEYIGEALVGAQSLQVELQVANPQEILTALLSLGTSPETSLDMTQDMSAEEVVLNAGPAAPIDVLSALAAVETNNKVVNETVVSELKGDAKELLAVPTAAATKVLDEYNTNDDSASNNEQLEYDSKYFDTGIEGVVIQFANLALTNVSDNLENTKQQAESLAASFAQRYQLTQYQYYTRLLNDQPYVVVTSMTYAQRAAAVSAMKQLSEELQQSGIWIKSTKTIATEMAASNR